MNRRTFLKAGAGLAGATIVQPQDRTRIIPAGPWPPATLALFPQSVASGDPQPRGIVLWTRLAPQVITGGTSATLGWQIATAPTFERNTIVLQGMRQVSKATDFTAKIVVSNEALQPWTVYYYRFGSQGVLSQTGRFKTLPAPGTSLSRVQLGYVSCQDFGNGYYTALAGLAAESIDYVVHLGDYIYETIADPNVQGSAVRPVPILPSGGLVAATLDDYRHLYRTYRSDTNLQLLHENFAFISVWDDHEFANDCYRDFHPDNNLDPGQPTPALRQAANQAWSEYTPSAISFDPQKNPLKSLRTYRSFRFGTLADLVLTDERLYRDGPPCGNDQADRYVTTGCPERKALSRTMLGPTQRAWFLNHLQSSPARWKLWGNEVMNMGLKVVNGTNDRYLTLDAWDGYPAERLSLMLSLAGVENLVAITGDIHSYAAGYLKIGYESVLAPRIGVEFVVGSVSSSNFVEVLASVGRRSPSAPMPRQVLAEAFPGGLLQFLVRLMNPHVQFFNSDTHGYNLLDITPEALTCTMKKVNTVAQPVATVSTLASFTVPHGQVAIVQA